MQLRNAFVPIVTTLSGRTTAVSEVFLSNAESPTIVTPSGIVTDAASPAYFFSVRLAALPSLSKAYLS